ncbi:MAG: MarR family transcriptional regulator [Tannerella sp.]|jgi:DNA-binding MarR family transcriptional regulator|nr:MarR family transcriptional regulator [Tannerella sp.]
MTTKKLPVLMHIALTMKAIERAFRKDVQALKLDLPSESFGILLIAYFQENSIQQEIAEMAHKDKSVVLRLIDTLENKGFIRRVTDGQDRRKNLIVTTDEGKKIAEAIVRRGKKLFGSLSSRIEKQDMATFVKVLLTLKNNAELY